MDIRLSLQELAERYGLSASASHRLNELAELDAEPANLKANVAFGMGILAAALGGLGIIFWIAANWESLSRLGRFALLEALVATMCAGAVFRPTARSALALLALLAIGGLFAFFGQTYQTGADPWQLFAIWAALALPLCLAVRNDVLWAPWALVAMTAVALWIHAHAGHGWSVRPPDLPYHVAGWTAALLVVFALSPPLQRFTGAGLWSMRVAVTLSTFIITWSGLFALLGESVAPQFVLGLSILCAAAMALCSARFHDTFALSAIGLALNVMLVGGLARLLFGGTGSDAVGKTMLIGMIAAGMLAGTVKIVMGVSRNHATGDKA